MSASITRPWRVVRARIRTGANRLLHHFELHRGRKREARADRTPIFVLGAPRSGTTLLQQLLVDQFELGWLANDHLRKPGGPSFIERIDKPRAQRTHSTFESEHGATKLAWEPHEGGEYWYRFFPRTPHEQHAVDATPKRTAAIRAAVREFADACGAPVVFKNVFNTVRVPVLAAALPEARFLLIERDLESNARSLLVGRARRGASADWWSVAPDGADALATAPPAEQVAWQVTRTNEVATAALAQLDADRSLTVSYAELCTDPAAVLDRIDAWLVAGGTQLARRPDAPAPVPFEQRAGGVLDPATEADLHRVLAARQDVGRR